MVEPVQVPATVDRELADPVATGGDQVPELLRRLDPAGQAQAHADDHHRVVTGHRGRRGGRLRRCRAENLLPYERGQPLRGRMVEDERRRK